MDGYGQDLSPVIRCLGRSMLVCSAFRFLAVIVFGTLGCMDYFLSLFHDNVHYLNVHDLVYC